MASLSSVKASRTVLLVVGSLLLGSFATGLALAGSYDEAKALHDAGNRLLDAGGTQDDPKRIREGLEDMRRARDLYHKALESPDCPALDRVEIQNHLSDVESKIDWWSALFPTGGKDGAKPEKLPEVKVPDPALGETLSSWCEKVRAIYGQQKDPLARSAVAQRMASKAGLQALATLLALWRAETDAKARAGVREALVLVGGSDLAKAMGDLAGSDDLRLRDEALEVIYGCLKKREKVEPEKPWCAAIRRFHERKDRKTTLRILTRLDEMGWSGIAALGEVLYVDDFGYHNYAIDLLGNKKDARAVPPLVHKMDRFTYEFREQFPAHLALIRMGYYAVPELIQHLDDPAAGIWVSWTLRKITGETMGTTRVKWDDWWIRERNHHPELFADPDERPPGTGGPETEGEDKPKTGK